MDYGIAPQTIEKKIRLVKQANIANGSTVGKKISSPQGTRSYVEVDPDYSSAKQPWNTTLYIGSVSDNKVFLQATFTDHGNTFSAHSQPSSDSRGDSFRSSKSSRKASDNRTEANGVRGKTDRPLPLGNLLLERIDYRYSRLDLDRLSILKKGLVSPLSDCIER